ncbi:hypothetical protein MSSAC_3125 [Methanosarcina siciliae C2J]|uniref:Uncharacterized protein n=1 Tax=Methanosarcina siciliae C2J TaxID=1434118 RepID=A0A0E3PSA6_9EURY|nr:hypothetical protein MSSAC_3125 [Methanosarcina siciliae C2J]
MPGRSRKLSNLSTFVQFIPLFLFSLSSSFLPPLLFSSFPFSRFLLLFFLSRVLLNPGVKLLNPFSLKTLLKKRFK